MNFATEQERDEAMAGVSTDAPPNTDIEKWEAETNAQIEGIMNATIGDAKAPNVDTPPVQEPIADLPPVQEPVVNSTTSKEPVAETELDRIKRHNQYLEQQNHSQTIETRATQTKLEQQIAELKAGGTKEVIQEKAKTELDHKIIATQGKLIQIEKEIAEEGEDSFGSEKSESRRDIQIELQNLKQEQANSIIASQGAQLNVFKENQNKISKEKAEKAEVEEIDKTMKVFQKNVPNLKTESSYSKLQSEYSKFSQEVAALYFPNVTAGNIANADAEKAMMVYLEGNPTLNQGLHNRGIAEPKELRKFINLSEINALQQGYVQDKLTGKFEPFTDSRGNRVIFPSFESAHNHLKMNNGDYGKEILEKQQEAAGNIVHAMTRRNDVVELDQNHQRELKTNDMTKERADQVIATHSLQDIVMRGRKDYNDPLVTEFNKALHVLGQATLSQEDFS